MCSSICIILCMLLFGTFANSVNLTTTTAKIPVETQHKLSDDDNVTLNSEISTSSVKEKNYRFSYEDENQKRDEKIKIKENPVNDENVNNENIVVHGRYSYVAADGVEYVVRYIADKKGFRPVVNVKRAKIMKK